MSWVRRNGPGPVYRTSPPETPASPLTQAPLLTVESRFEPLDLSTTTRDHDKAGDPGPKGIKITRPSRTFLGLARPMATASPDRS